VKVAWWGIEQQRFFERLLPHFRFVYRALLIHFYFTVKFTVGLAVTKWLIVLKLRTLKCPNQYVTHKCYVKSEN